MEDGAAAELLFVSYAPQPERKSTARHLRLAQSLVDLPVSLLSVS